MADETQHIRGINWREVFPFFQIFRSFRIAVHPSKLMLGLIALLALYIGGRALDGLWSAKHLAVPGEVYDYERNVADGGTSEQFSIARRRERDAIEDAYAQRLLDLNIVKDRTEADRAAANGEHLSKVRDALLKRRNDSAANTEKVHTDAITAADKISDPRDKARARQNADEAYQTAMRSAYNDAYQELRGAKAIKGMGLFHSFFEYEAKCVIDVVNGVVNGNWLGTPREERGAGVVACIAGFFTVGPVWLMRFHPLYFILFTLLFLTIWAVFGGAICRIAAVHVARDEKLSVRGALAFSMGKFLSFVSAPLIPLGIVLIVGLVPLLAGFLASIPFVGPIFNILMGAFFVLILAAGFVMTLVLLGTFGGFNLMYPTIAVEGSDSFDAISRSFSYVYARPWRMVFYTLVAILYGALTYLFVRMFIWLMLSLTHHFVGAGMFAIAPSTDPLWPAMWRGPSAPPGRLSYDIDYLTLAWHQDIAATLVAFWVYLVVAMLGAFAISFYFTSNTIIYYLMRHEVDATEMDDVYLEQSEEDFADAPAPLMPPASPPPAEVAAQSEQPISDAPPDAPEAPPT